MHTYIHTYICNTHIIIYRYRQAYIYIYIYTYIHITLNIMNYRIPYHKVPKLIGPPHGNDIGKPSRKRLSPHCVAHKRFKKRELPDSQNKCKAAGGYAVSWGQMHCSKTSKPANYPVLP